MLRSRWARVGLVVAGVGLMALALLRTYPPYVWVAGIGAVVALLWLPGSRGRARVLAVNAAALFAIFAIAEGAAWRLTPAGPLRTRSEPVFVVSHDYLGNAPAPGVTATVSRWDGDSLLFHVDYHIDPSGWRVTPGPDAGTTNAREALFFGCSLTFGEGLPDSATLPAQFALQSRGAWRARNFGVSGYGPHQMLAILEHGLERSPDRDPPSLAVYQAIPSHIYRALGRTTWDPGPRYVLEPDGGVRFAGRFLSPRASLVLNLFYRSFLLRKVLDAWQARLTARDFATFAAIVGGARDRWRERYPGAEFVVLYWNTREASPAARALDDSLLAGFARLGLRVVTAGEILPGYLEEPGRYRLGPHDAHPDAEADRRLAAGLLERFPAAARGE